MVQNISIADYLLLFPYLAIFFVIAKRMSKAYAEPDLRKHMMAAFWLRMLGSILYCMVVQYYYGYGDTFTFYKGGNFFTDQFKESLSNLHYLFASAKETGDWYSATPGTEDEFAGYFSNPSGNLVMKISAVLSYFSFNRFLIISLFFGFFSFYGQWKLFLVFDDVNKHRNRKLLAYATLYTPSIWFWGSGLLKDSVCIGALGVMVNIAYNMVVKKKFSMANIIVFAILAFFVTVIKSYISAILFASLGVTAVFLFLKRMKNMALRIVLIVVFLTGGLLVISQLDISAQITEVVEDSVMQIKGFQEAYQSVNADDEASRAGFSMGDLNPSLGSLAMQAPGAIFTCLYRPFIWESRKVMIMFTSLESMLLLYCTLYLFKKTKLFGFFKAIFSNEYLFFAFLMSILFALVIGFTTFNFGTMIRYKIILLPFFYFLMVHIYTMYVQKPKIVDVSGTSSSTVEGPVKYVIQQPL